MSLGRAREPDQVMQVLPMALRRLRLGAGQSSIRGAARAIQEQTGTLVNAAMISQWEREGAKGSRVASSTASWRAGSTPSISAPARSLPSEVP